MFSFGVIGLLFAAWYWVWVWAEVHYLTFGTQTPHTFTSNHYFFKVFGPVVFIIHFHVPYWLSVSAEV
jgi:hypothetical protein